MPMVPAAGGESLRESVAWWPEFRARFGSAILLPEDDGERTELMRGFATWLEEGIERSILARAGRCPADFLHYCRQLPARWGARVERECLMFGLDRGFSSEAGGFADAVAGAILGRIADAAGDGVWLTKEAILSRYRARLP
jgi:hypothetical protein